MGVRGTDAAKEAADIVLADDNYSTITQGIFEGRKFFDNLSKCVKYYLSVKVALIVVFALPVLLNVPFRSRPSTSSHRPCSCSSRPNGPSTPVLPGTRATTCLT
jgi:magnesium-transporting ATPase (P-type)